MGSWSSQVQDNWLQTAFLANRQKRWRKTLLER